MEVNNQAEMTASDALKIAIPPTTSVPAPAPAASPQVEADDSWELGLRLRNFYKLKTREDPIQAHKVLGLICLAHYIYRFGHLIRFGTMGFEQTEYYRLLFVFFLHAALSFSSFIFHLPTKRNKHKPMIWPELRAHNAVFALRSILDAGFHIIGLSHPLLRFLLVYAAMFAADVVTEFYRDRTILARDDGTTVRGMPWPKDADPRLVAFTNHFYSVAQLMATAGVLSTSPTWAVDVELAFCTLFPIQLSALLMTMVRKSVISPFAWHFYYGASLVWAFAPIFFREDTIVRPLFTLLAVGIFFFFVRMKLNVNKYILWVLVTILRPAKPMYEDYPF